MVIADAQVDAARVPPQSVEAEQSVLGGLLLDNAAWDRIADVVGEAKVEHMAKPTMGGEDFSFMLNKKQGAYLMLGGRRTPDDAMVHHPRYDFNDAILPVGASYFARLVEQLLPRP